MSGFKDVMKLKEQAEEDIYFARLDRELVEKLRRKAAAARTEQIGEQEGAGPDKAQSGAPEGGRLPAQ